jgi:hypothetical protein
MWQLAFQGLLSSVETVESSCRRVSICSSGCGMLVCHRLQSDVSILICTNLSPLFISFLFHFHGLHLRNPKSVRVVCVDCDDMTLEGVEHSRMVSSHQINIFVLHRKANFWAVYFELAVVVSLKANWLLLFVSSFVIYI